MAGCRGVLAAQAVEPGPASSPEAGDILRLAVSTGEAVSARALRTLERSARG